MELRDYQSEALERIAEAHQHGHKRALLVAATGLGKTVVFATYARQHGGSVLVLAHRDELIRQAVDKVLQVWPDMRLCPGAAKLLGDERDVLWSRAPGIEDAPWLGVAKGGLTDYSHADVLVASVQTVARAKGLEVLGALRWDLVVVDEAHHATAASYRKVLAAAGCDDAQGPNVLGVTATPDRGDGTGLDGVFDQVVANYDLLWGINAGYLADIRGQAIEVEHLDLGEVKVSRGDYAAGDTGRALEEAGGPQQIVAAWLEHALGRRTLVYTPTVETAASTAAQFAAAGVEAGVVHGALPLDERRAVLAAYEAGDLQVITNCMVLTEGFDSPRTDCIVVARPTKSRALYAQMVGRGTRLHPAKTDCLVLDVVGASDQHSLVTIPSLFGLPDAYTAELRSGEHTLSGLVEAHQQELVRIGQLKAQEAELFRRVRHGGIHWTPVDRSLVPRPRYERSLGGDEIVVLAQREDSDDWVAGLWWPKQGRKRTLLAHGTMETAQQVAEDYIRKGDSRLGVSDASWRSKPPTPKQRSGAKRMGIDKDTIASARTRGELSDLIDQRLADFRHKRKVTADE